MTVASIAQARDEITAMATTALQAGGLTGAIQYDDIGPPPPFASWARVTIKHQTGEQASLANVFGKRRYSRVGTVYVQIFTKPGDGLSASDVLTKLVQDAFEGKSSPGGVWFRQVRVNEIGNNGGFYQVNVLADFTYDEVK